MANGNKGELTSATDGGVSGEHVDSQQLVFPVGPTTEDKYNTIKLPEPVIACWRVDDIRFAFDSSFLNGDPNADSSDDIRVELVHILKLVREHPDSPLSVFGHADPVGSDDYNKQLSGRRAMVVYGLLLANGDPDTGKKLWQQVAAAEHWGKSQREVMGQVTGLGSATPADTIIKAYMQKLCPPELKLTKKDFLAQGADSGGKGDYQGCSEFNPSLLFSKEDQDRYDQAQQRQSQDDQPTLKERNGRNSVNRRVMVLLFRKGSKVDPDKWPCPRASEGDSGCKTRFWSDGEKRRSTHLPGTNRRFENTGDTFACRFYHRLMKTSPCEGMVYLSTILLVDEIGLPVPNAVVKLTANGSTWTDITDANGKLGLKYPPGTSVKLQVVETHEVGPGDSIVTPSGHHFRTNGPGP